LEEDYDMKTIWVVDDNFAPAAMIEKAAQVALKEAPVRVKRVSDVTSLKRLCAQTRGKDAISRPDLIVIDLDMGVETTEAIRKPRESGLSAIAFLEQEFSRVPYMIYSDVNDFGGGRILSALAAFRFGKPAALVAKDAKEEQLVDTLEDVLFDLEATNEGTVRYRNPGNREERAIDTLFLRDTDLEMWRAHAAGTGGMLNKASKWRAEIIGRVVDDQDTFNALPEQLKMLGFPTEFELDGRNSRNTKDAIIHFAGRHRMTLNDPVFEQMLSTK
jgi:CheY-like chemotaxis protein